jgi:hypothetical protein
MIVEHMNSNKSSGDAGGKGKSRPKPGSGK